MMRLIVKGFVDVKWSLRKPDERNAARATTEPDTRHKPAEVEIGGAVCDGALFIEHDDPSTLRHTCTDGGGHLIARRNHELKPLIARFLVTVVEPALHARWNFLDADHTYAVDLIIVMFSVNE